MAVLEEVGVRAIVEGASRYVSDGQQVNKATLDMGASAKSAADSYKVFEQAQTRAQAQLRETAQRFQEVGRQAIIFGAALAVPGIAATKLASDFDASIVKLHTLSGVATADLDSMRQGIFDISRTTGRGPQELADALLVVTSTGISGAKALDILRYSAQLSAVGLGDTTTIARALTGALSAFSAQGLTAAEAAGVLIATVREGGAEVTAVAGSLGRVNAIAATLGLTFADVGAFVATFTRTGVDADEAVTALRGTLTILLGTSNESKKAVESLGLSLADLRKQAKEDGLAAALKTILDAAKGDDEIITNLIPNVRALAGVLSVSGQQGAAYAEVQKRIKDSLRDTAAAFDAASKTPQFKYNQAIADLQGALIQLGSQGLPVLTAVAQSVSALATAFSQLPGPVQGAALAFSVLGGSTIALVGSLALIGGSVLRLVADIPTLISQIQLLGAGVLASPAGWIALASAIVVASLAYVLIKSKIDEVNRTMAANTEGQRLAISLTREEIQGRLTDLQTRRDAAQALLEELQLRSAMPDEIVAQVQKLQILNDLTAAYSAALKISTTDEQARTKAAAQAAAQQAATNAALDAAIPSVVRLSDSTKQLKKDIEAVTAASLAWKIIDDDLKNIQGANPENILSLIGPDVLQRQAEQAGKILKPYLDLQNAIVKITEGVQNSAGGLTKSQISEANKAETEAERLAKAEHDRVERAIDDAKKAAETIAQARIQSIDQLGDLIASALRKQASTQFDIQKEALDKSKKALTTSINDEIDAIKKRTSAAVTAAEKQRDAEVKAAEKARDLRIKAIEDERDARVAALNAQIAALQGEADTGQRVELVRKIALSYDAKERADAEKALADFDRQQQINGLQDQIKVAQDGASAQIDATKEASAAQIDTLKAASEARIELIKTTSDALIAADEKARDAAIAGFEDQATAAQKAYEKQTSEFTIQSEVRKLLMNGETAAIAKLLDEQVPEWRSAGLSYGQQMVQGLEKSGVNEYINGLLGKIAQVNAAFGGSAGASAAASQVAAQTALVQGQQQQGIRAVQGGAPQSVIDSLRDQLIKMGVVPQFAGGLDVGVVRRPILAALDPGEVVLTPSQQQQYMGGGRGVTFERGAFDGAIFSGSPEENAAAIQRQIDASYGQQTGRGAFLNGV